MLTKIAKLAPKQYEPRKKTFHHRKRFTLFHILSVCGILEPLFEIRGNQMTEYMLFLDETKSNTNNPFFCLAGYAIAKDDYEKVLIPSINTIKIQNFGDTSTIFHFTEMKKNKNAFVSLVNTSKRVSFWSQLYTLIDSLPIVTFGCYFDSCKLKSIYPHRSTTEYDIALHYNVENYIHFLRSVDGIGSIMVESRTMRENQKLQDYYYMVLNNGTQFFSKEDVREHIAIVGYIIKKDNCAGLQIADFIPSSFMRMINKQSDFNNFGQMLLGKLYDKTNGNHDILGLKRVV